MKLINSNGLFYYKSHLQWGQIFEHLLLQVPLWYAKQKFVKFSDLVQCVFTYEEREKA